MRAREEEHPLYPAIHLIAYTGIRRGEALGLMWSDVDLDAGTIIINRSVIRTQQHGVLIQPVKAERSRRKIDVDPDTVTALRTHRVHQQYRLKLGVAYEDCGLLFPNDLG